MTTILETHENNLRIFDERFRPIDFCNVGDNKMEYVEQTRDEIKSHLTSSTKAILEAVKEVVAKESRKNDTQASLIHILTIISKAIKEIK